MDGLNYPQKPPERPPSDPRLMRAVGIAFIVAAALAIIGIAIGDIRPLLASIPAFVLVIAIGTIAASRRGPK